MEGIYYKVIHKLIEDDVEKAILILPLWASQSWFPLIIDHIISYPVRLPRHRDLLTLVHNNSRHPLSKSLNMVVVGVALQNRGIPKSVAMRIINSWRPGTRKQYGLAWNKVLWCHSRFESPVYTSEEIVL